MFSNLSANIIKVLNTVKSFRTDTSVSDDDFKVEGILKVQSNFDFVELYVYRGDLRLFKNIYSTDENQHKVVNDVLKEVMPLFK